MKSERSMAYTVDRFLRAMEEAGVFRAYVMYQDGQLMLSHPELLEPVREILEISPDYAAHEAIFLAREDGIPALFLAAVHKTTRGLSQGGLRLKDYPDLRAAVVDGLRLSRGMTRKNAIAGLWWGGGKGVIPLTPALQRFLDSAPDARRHLFEAYGCFVTSLGGIYYAAEDIGTTTADMDAIYSCSRFTTCISQKYGGSGNPSGFTAAGVFQAMEAAWEHLTSSRRLNGVRVSVQGAGNVGFPLIQRLYAAGAFMAVSDPSPSALDRVRALSAEIAIIDSLDSIYRVEADIFAPCAVGGTVNEATIPILAQSGVRLILGAANNIVERDSNAAQIAERNILFVPDFAVNYLGIVNCANEPWGYRAADVEKVVATVYPLVREILNEAERRRLTPLAISNERADSLAEELDTTRCPNHARDLMADLIASGWCHYAPSRLAA